jgi:hypothetical protein
MDELLERYRKERNIEMILHRQSEILSHLPKESLLLRDKGSVGLFYQCANCGLIIEEDEGIPQMHECYCENKFYENGEFKIFDVTELLDIEYELEDLERSKQKDLTNKDPNQLTLDKYLFK